MKECIAQPDGKLQAMGDDPWCVANSTSAPYSRADWCKDSTVFDESMIFGIIMHHTITNDFMI